MKDQFEIDINGKLHTIEAESDKPLLWVLRDELDLTGTKYGCGVGQCGACTVHLDDTPVRSCGITIGSIGKAKVTTIEGIAKEDGHPVIKMWAEINVPQCGYCQTGQIMSTLALLKGNKSPSEKEIDAALRGNICRCGTYFRIRNAIEKLVE